MLLLEITDNNEPVYELSSIFKYFPKTADSIIAKLKRSHKLLFHGVPLYEPDGSDGPGIDAAVEACKTSLKNGDRVDVQIGSFEFEAKIEECQHVWTGYSRERDCLLLGFDGWISEDEFNSAWDEYFEREYGEPFDMDNEDHNDLFLKVHQEFMKMGFYGLLFEVNFRDGGRHIAPRADLDFYNGQGFFKGVQRAGHLGGAIEL